MNAKRLTFVLMLGVLMLSACGSVATRTAAPAATSAPAANSYGGNSGYQAPVASTVVPGQPPSSGSSQPSTIQRMVIMNASLEIVVESPDVVVQTISNMALEMGGFVVSSNSYKTTASSGVSIPQAKITLRVPAQKLNAALDKIRSLVKNTDQDIHNETLSGQDVTEDYTDLGSQLINLQAAEKQLQAILEKATKTEDVLSVFHELTNTRQQIEVLQGKMKYYEQSAALSSIDVAILATASIAPIEIAGWQPLGIARDAIQTLINIGKFLAGALIWIVIVGLPLGLVFGFPIYLVRKLRKPRKPAAMPPAAPAIESK
jgi:hypothetical protein